MKALCNAAVLALDTSGSYCSVAVRQSSGAIVSLHSEGAGDHFEQLQCLVAQVCEQAQVRMPDLAGITVGVGPGSFTGLRIGMSFAKGVAVATRSPLRGISSFLGLAQTASAKKRIGPGGLAVIADARRDEVFMATYEAASDGLREVSVPAIVSIATLAAWSRACPERVILSSVKDFRPDGVGDIFNEPDVAPGLILCPQTVGLVYSAQEVADLEPEYLRAVAAKSIEERKRA